MGTGSTVRVEEYAKLIITCGCYVLRKTRLILFEQVDRHIMMTQGVSCYRNQKTNNLFCHLYLLCYFFYRNSHKGCRFLSIFPGRSRTTNTDASIERNASRGTNYSRSDSTDFNTLLTIFSFNSDRRETCT